MVLSLVHLSLLSIANGIKDGTIQHPHFLPPKLGLRQRVLDTVLKRDFINDPKCLTLLSSVEFLDGMESFGSEPGNYDLEFLNRLEESMATELPNGETVGAGITKLNLSVYGIAYSSWKLGYRWVKASSFPLVSQLINQCPNTTSLVLCGIKSERALEEPHPYCEKRSWFPSVLNENDACTMVMENLVELSLRDMEKVLSDDRPIINFNRLTTLKLDNCSIQVDIWAEFLVNVPTLEKLHMIGVKGVGTDDLEWRPHPDANGLDWVLPFSMPKLKSLMVITIDEYQFIFQCNKAFVDNLMECPEIGRVQLSLDQKSIDEESMERLASMNIDLTVKARFVINENDDISAALDSSSKFKVVRILHESMDSFELCVWQRWKPQFTTALEDAVDSCSKLTKLSVYITEKFQVFDHTEIEPVKEMKRINAAMIQFLGNQERAMQLKDLRLRNNFDEAVMLAVFESCLNLDRLEMSYCRGVRDHHLIDWVSNGGGKLTRLVVFHCPNITIEGIIPVLAKSGEGLLRNCIVFDSGEEYKWKTVFKNLCPNAKRW